MQIQFKTKIQKHYSGGDMIQIKKALTRSDVVGDHAYINSNIMPQILARISAKLIPQGFVFIDELPEFIKIEGKFLKTVTIQCTGEEWRENQ